MGEKFASSILAIGKIPLKNGTFLKSKAVYGRKICLFNFGDWQNSLEK